MTCPPPPNLFDLFGRATGPPARNNMTATALDENVTNETLTIGQYLAEGPLPLAEALRYAMMLAETLRQLHDSGRTCGALTPSNIAVTDRGLELIAAPSHPSDITPYTAPELLQGQPADVRSDIFAFGAILYEMVMDHRAFAGDSAEELAASLTTSTPPLSGTPGHRSRDRQLHCEGSGSSLPAHAKSHPRAQAPHLRRASCRSGRPEAKCRPRCCARKRSNSKLA